MRPLRSASGTAPFSFHGKILLPLFQGFITGAPPPLRFGDCTILFSRQNSFAAFPRIHHRRAPFAPLRGLHHSLFTAKFFCRFSKDSSPVRTFRSASGTAPFSFHGKILLPLFQGFITGAPLPLRFGDCTILFSRQNSFADVLRIHHRRAPSAPLRGLHHSLFTAKFFCRCSKDEWCEGGELNPHGLPRQNLNLVRLPVSPPSHLTSGEFSSPHLSRRVARTHSRF